MSLAVLQPEIDSAGDAMEGKATAYRRSRDAVRATIPRLQEESNMGRVFLHFQRPYNFQFIYHRWV
jgi:hypothetical protein